MEKEFEVYLKCGRLENGFLPVRCELCRLERLVAFSCKKRGSCPSCGARRMADDCRDAVRRAKQEPEPRRPRFLFAAYPDALAWALEVIYRLPATSVIESIHSASRGWPGISWKRWSGIAWNRGPASPESALAGRTAYARGNRRP